MDKLSLEINRLLGHALLDNELQRNLLGTDRRAVLSKYQLTEEEKRVVLSSQAVSLPALAAELCRTLAQPDPQLELMEIGRMARGLGIKPISNQELRIVIDRVLASREHPHPIGTELTCYKTKQAAA